MQTTTLSFANMHNHGELLANLLRARRESFIVKKNWDLPEALGMEYDQYDTPASRWIAVHDLGQVYAGIRLTPTTARCGIYTYMIRDAQRGLLDTIPADLLDEEAPVAESVWESSRIFVSQATPVALRRRVHLSLISELCKSARELGATRVLGLIPTALATAGRRFGMDISPAGRVIEFDEIPNQCISIDLSGNLH